MTHNVVFQFLLVAINFIAFLSVKSLMCKVRGSMCSGVNLYCCSLCGFHCEV